MSEKNPILPSGPKDQYQNGLQIPLINPLQSEEQVHWLELRKAECLLFAPNSPWKHAHLYFMHQAAKWEERLRSVKRERLERNLNC